MRYSRSHIAGKVHFPCLPLCEVGEIQVRSYGVMRSYFDDPAATAAALDGDGWLRTGDLGSMAVRPLRHNLMFNKDELKGGLR